MLTSRNDPRSLGLFIDSIAPQNPPDAPNAPPSGWYSDIGHFSAFPGIHPVIHPTIPSIEPHFQTASQTPYLPKRSEHHEKRGSGGIAEAGNGSPSMSSMDPPRHSRSLYHSIDLPDLGDEPPIFLPPDLGAPSGIPR